MDKHDPFTASSTHTTSARKCFYKSGHNGRVAEDPRHLGRKRRRTLRRTVPPNRHRTNEMVAHVATDPHCRMDTNQAMRMTQTPEKQDKKQRVPSTKSD